MSRQSRPSPRAPTWAARSRTGPTSGTTEYPFGTEVNGRDILSRIIFAARISPLVSVEAAAIGGRLGVLAGLVSG